MNLGEIKVSTILNKMRRIYYIRQKYIRQAE